MNDALEALLRELGLENIHAREKEILARCPKHQQRTGRREVRPRHWSINRESGLHYCFSCGYSGNLLHLVIDVAKCSPWDARQMIRSHRLDTTQPPTTLFDQDADDDEDEAEYLDITEHLERFGPPPGRALRQRGLSWPAVSRYGVRWDVGEAAWILPIRGPGGDTWGYQSKSMDQVLNHPAGVRKSRTLFGIDLLIEQPQDWRDQVCLVESPLDVVYMDGLGFPAVASFGAIVSDHQLRLLSTFFDRFTLALDNDVAGRRETMRLLRTHWCRQRPVDIFNYDAVVAKDPGGMCAVEIGLAIDKAKPALVWQP